MKRWTDPLFAYLPSAIHRLGLSQDIGNTLVQYIGNDENFFPASAKTLIPHAACFMSQ